MTQARDATSMAPERDRAALLVIRVWVDAGSDPPAMRARLSATDDLEDREAQPRITVAAEVEDICEQVRTWLGRFLARTAAGDEAPPAHASDAPEA